MLTCRPATSTEANSAPQPPPQLKPGTLRVTLHEGRGFSLPAEVEKMFSQPGGPLSTSVRQPASSLSQNSTAGSYYNQQRAPKPATATINSAPTNHGRYSAKHLPYALVDFDKQQVFVNAVSGNPENPLWAGDNTGYQFDVSRATDLTISFYIRNPAAPPSAGRNHDILVGTCRVNPRFEETPRPAVDPKKKGMPGQSERPQTAGWVPMIFGTGNFKLGLEFVETRQRSLNIEDFELLKVVGKGSFGKVMQVK
jgi:serum/glucocorticoid-regulated kinase 2